MLFGLVLYALAYARALAGSLSFSFSVQGGGAAGVARPRAPGRVSQIRPGCAAPPRAIIGKISGSGPHLGKVTASCSAHQSRPLYRLAFFVSPRASETGT